jgi:1-acyl-sn-glycerol-3-phosphate acyltransferase
MAVVTSKFAGESLIARMFYIAIRGLVVFLCRIWLRLGVAGSQHVPRTGAFILAPTHRSTVDIPIASAVTKRRMRFMGKDSLWKIKIVGSFFSALGAFPVTRGSADLEALRRCIAVLESGQPIVMFPEGTRRIGNDVVDLFDGAAYISFKTGLPIVPVGIAGSERVTQTGSKMIRPLRCYAVVGEPIWPVSTQERRASREEISALTAKVGQSLQNLFDQADQAIGNSQRSK